MLRNIERYGYMPPWILMNTGIYMTHHRDYMYLGTGLGCPTDVWDPAIVAYSLQLVWATSCSSTFWPIAYVSRPISQLAWALQDIRVLVLDVLLTAKILPLLQILHSLCEQHQVAQHPDSQLLWISLFHNSSEHHRIWWFYTHT